mmetsp:Transcript_23462/g.67605  ORF Transcript_23462/g.67605 Transcript_23462/m.67605 type:complete len:408 (-) Transcript_23462:15-1238(-)
MIPQRPCSSSVQSAVSASTWFVLTMMATSAAVTATSTSAPGGTFRAKPFMPPLRRVPSATAASQRIRPISSSLLHNIPRGGSTAAAAAAPPDKYLEESDEEDEDEEDAEEKQQAAAAANEEAAKLQKWKTEQQLLLNLRSTFLSEALAMRGLPITTIADVSIADGDKPPEPTDWDCAMATEEEPKSCLYSFDAEPNSKVVAPIGTENWISISALNRLRRTDTAKVEPMWHSKYAVLRSWFSDESQFSFLQHTGFRGFLLSNLLLDLGGGIVLRSLVVLSILATLIVSMPALEYFVNRLLVSGPFWAKWISWRTFVHASLPLKLIMGQLAWKLTATGFGKLEGKIRDYAVDMESAMLEECVPLTVVPVAAEIDDDDAVEDETDEFDFGMLDNDDDGDAYEDYSESDNY